MATWHDVTRRRLLKGATAATVVVSLNDWLSTYAEAQPRPVMTRSEVGTADGQKMLALYGKGVGIMKELPFSRESSFR